MPQIANQDFNIVRPALATNIVADAEALGQLAGHLKRGTIFDVIVEKSYEEVDGPSRITAVNAVPGGTAVFSFSYSEGTVMGITLYHTQEQYSGLAAIQRETKENNVPQIGEDDNGYLCTGVDDAIDVCVNGNLVTPIWGGENGDALVSYTITNVKATGEFVNITEEDLANLIGVINTL